MLRDLALVNDERSFELRDPDELPALSETRNLGEWLLWSKRECAMFRRERILTIPTRHPVCADDASFYWYGGVHIRAMARQHIPFAPHPSYAVLREDILREKPAFIESGFLNDNVLPDPDVTGLLDREYVRIQWGRNEFAWIRADLLSSPSVAR
jgi:hypothetical protein